MELRVEVLDALELFSITFCNDIFCIQFSIHFERIAIKQKSFHLFLEDDRCLTQKRENNDVVRIDDNSISDPSLK